VNKSTYLERIKYTGSLDPTLEVLGRLQEAHLENIPFENLDIHSGVPIELNIEKIYNKIVLNKRGGFCYELNGLFYELLLDLGFTARRVSARVFDKSKGYGLEFDHLAIIVEIDGTYYLSDVGFGEFSFSPLKLETGIVQKDVRGNFLIQEYDKDYLLVSSVGKGILSPQYIFSTRAREFKEFSDMCHYHQTSPESHFTKGLLISRPTPEGRISLTQDLLKIREGDTITETPLGGMEMFRDMLKKYFSIESD
jgi:N-hydroxyarylamine O-acetyltransferase